MWLYYSIHRKKNNFFFTFQNYPLNAGYHLKRRKLNLCVQRADTAFKMCKTVNLEALALHLVVVCRFFKSGYILCDFNNLGEILPFPHLPTPSLLDSNNLQDEKLVQYHPFSSFSGSIGVSFPFPVLCGSVRRPWSMLLEAVSKFIQCLG